MSYATLSENCPSLKEQHTYDFFASDLGLEWYNSNGKWPTTTAVPQAPWKYTPSCGDKGTLTENYVRMGKLLNQSALGDPKYSFHTTFFKSPANPY